MTRILILDAEQRSSLAAIRALGKQGLRIVALSYEVDAIGFRSRYAEITACGPDPISNAGGYLASIVETVRKHKVDYVLPMTDQSCELLFSQIGRLGINLLHPPSYDHYKKLSDKTQLLQLCSQLDIRFPKSIFVQKKQHSDLPRYLKDISFPVVIKPSLSKVKTDNGFIATNVEYASCTEELVEIIGTRDWLSNHPFIVQEHIVGDGVGFFALCQEGSIVSSYSHRRIRQKPPSGGVSVYCKTIDANTQAEADARKLITNTSWSGPIMVEFIVDENDRAFVIEVNGRYWGSLQLGVSAGVNFPYLSYLLATEKEFEPCHDYKRNVRLRWILGDLDNMYIQFRDRSLSLQQKFRALVSFCTAFFVPVHGAVFQFSDPRPFFAELRLYMRSIFK